MKSIFNLHVNQDKIKNEEGEEDEKGGEGKDEEAVEEGKSY